MFRHCENRAAIKCKMLNSGLLTSVDWAKGYTDIVVKMDTREAGRKIGPWLTLNEVLNLSLTQAGVVLGSFRGSKPSSQKWQLSSCNKTCHRERVLTNTRQLVQGRWAQ